MTATPYTAAARKKAKRMLAAFRNDEIQIWPHRSGRFEVITFGNPGNTYVSIGFPSKADAFQHIIVRAANTGFDMQRFEAIALRYFRRYLAA